MPCRPRELRIKLYDEVLRLRRQGLTYKEITNNIQRGYGVRLSKSHISYWIRRLHSPYNGIQIPSIEFLRPSEKLAYVIGVVAGDGYVQRKSRVIKGRACLIGLKVKDREFAEEFGRRIAEVLGREPPKPRINNHGRWVVEVQSKTIYEFLRKTLNLKRLRPFIEHSDECRGAFLRGFFDSEGSVEKHGRIIVYNSDYELLCYVRRILLRLGIRTTQRQPKINTHAGRPSKNPRTGKPFKSKKHTYYLTISMKSNYRFYEKVGFIIRRKRRRLEDYLRRRRRPTIPSISPSKAINISVGYKGQRYAPHITKKTGRIDIRRTPL